MFPWELFFWTSLPASSNIAFQAPLGRLDQGLQLRAYKWTTAPLTHAEMKIRIVAFLSLLLMVSAPLRSQDSEIAIESLFRVDYDIPLTIDLDSLKAMSDEVIEPVKKRTRKKRRTFYGTRTRRGFIRGGNVAGKPILELFYYLKKKDFVQPGTYDTHFFWYDRNRGKIVSSLRVKNAGHVRIVHGPYVKKWKDTILESGYFYFGTKHGRWVRYNRSDILQDKKKYWKGLLEDSKISYYDHDRQYVREIIPVHGGERHGDYYAFHPNGRIAARGKYRFDQPVGKWHEYYASKRIKREVEYPEDPFDKVGRPRILREWDREGKLIYE